MDIKAINFDFYGTLVDYFSVWEEVSKIIINGNNLKVSSADFISEWKTTQRILLEKKEFTDYKELVKLSLSITCKKYGVKNQDYHKIIFEKWSDIKPFSEVPNTLKKLKSKYELAICSNSSRDLYEACAAKLPFKFQNILLSDETKVNKPHPKMYQIAIKTLGFNPENILHVASSLMDVKGAANANLIVCWINRRNEKILEVSAKPEFEIKKLDEIFNHLK